MWLQVGLSQQIDNIKSWDRINNLVRLDLVGQFAMRPTADVAVGVSQGSQAEAMIWATCTAGIYRQDNCGVLR